MADQTHFIEIVGPNAADLSEPQKVRILQTVVDCTERMPVNAKVVLIEPMETYEFKICAITVGSNAYFIGITGYLLIIMDLRDVRSFILVQLHEWDMFYEL